MDSIVLISAYRYDMFQEYAQAISLAEMDDFELLIHIRNR